jgi:hypothetical protein
VPIKWASVEKSPERPVFTRPEVLALAEAIDERYAALILLAALVSLRSANWRAPSQGHRRGRDHGPRVLLMGGSCC